MKFNFFTIGILLGFLPNILGLDANLDLNSKIVLQMLITMIFLDNRGYSSIDYGFNTNINLTIFN